MRFLVLFLGGCLCSDLPSCGTLGLFGSDSFLWCLGLSEVLGFEPELLEFEPEGLVSTLVEARILPLVPAGIFRSVNRCSELE